MDLRVKKTKRAIQTAFAALIMEKPVEKITVREISERAEINKSTFYAHYETLDALKEDMEQQATQMICCNVEAARQLLEQPETFVKEMSQMLEKYRVHLGHMSTESMGHFAQHLRDAILERIKDGSADPLAYESIGSLLIFVIHGLLGLQNMDSALAQKQLDFIAAFVATGVRGMQLSK